MVVVELLAGVEGEDVVVVVVVVDGLEDAVVEEEEVDLEDEVVEGLVVMVVEEEEVLVDLWLAFEVLSVGSLRVEAEVLEVLVLGVDVLLEEDLL